MSKELTNLTIEAGTTAPNGLQSAAGAPSSLRFCRKCLLEGVTQEEMTAKIRDYLAALPEEEQTAPTVYNSRLAVCGTCSRLENGLCKECGCFVLYRAGRASLKCPVEKW